MNVHQQKENWTCTHCTFNNHYSFKNCEICQQPKLLKLPNVALLQQLTQTELSKLNFKHDHFSDTAAKIKQIATASNDFSKENNSNKSFQKSENSESTKNGSSIKNPVIFSFSDTPFEGSNIQTEILSPIASDKPIPRLEVPPNEDVDDTLKKIYETKNEKELSKYNVDNISNTHLFEDPFFPACNSSIGSSYSEIDKLCWRRLEEFINEDELKESNRILRADFKPSDVLQGQLGNCWFVSTVSLLANHPKLLDRVMETKEVSKLGAYQFKLYVEGKWTSVLIDSRVPCVKSTGKIAFTTGARNQIFIPLIEKVLAKMHGSYDSLVSGLGIESLSTLTGMPCRPIQLQPDVSGRVECDQNIWTKIESAHNANYMIVASCGFLQDSDPNRYELVGLRFRHNYSVHDVRLVVREDNNKPEYLVQFRNPWGRFVWSGDWCESSSLWNSNRGLREALMTNSPGTSCQGMFWMSFYDIKKYFQRFDVCMVNLDWKLSSFSGNFPEGATTMDDISECTAIMRIEKTSEVELSIFQHTHRKSNRKSDCCLLVFKSRGTDSNGKYLLDKCVLHTKRTIKLQLSCGGVLDKGTYVIVGIAFNHWCVPKQHKTIPELRSASKPFTVTIHSRQKVNISRVKIPNKLSEVIFRLIKDKGYLDPKGSYLRLGLESYSLKGLGPPILMVVNSSKSLQFHVTSVICVSESAKNEFIPTRGTYSTYDVLDPLHFQIVNMLTRVVRQSRCQISTSVTAKVKKPNENLNKCQKKLTNLRVHPNLFKSQPIPSTSL